MSKSKDEELERLKQKKMKEMMEKRRGPDFPDSPISLTDGNFHETIQKYPVVVVDLWAGWCAPCRAMEPVIEELAEKYSGKIVFGKLNVDQNPKIPRKFQVSGIPTLLVFKDGELVDRIVGMVTQPKLKLRLEKHLG